MIVEGGSVVDGYGRSSTRADLAIKDEKTAKIGKLHGEPSDCKIGASGRIVAPGFIDMHAQSCGLENINPQLHRAWTRQTSRRQESLAR